MRRLPRERLEEVIAGDRQIGRDQIRQRRIVAACDEVLTACLEIVVLDQQRSWPVEDRNRLAVSPHLPEAADI